LLTNEKPEDLTGENGLFKELKKALIERALGSELTEHLGYEKGDPAGRGSSNSRNGTSSRFGHCPARFCSESIQPNGIRNAADRPGF
jgi:transposase-like protein